MPDLAICFVGDVNFLLGSLISIRSLRKFVKPDQAEIYLFYLDPDEAVLEKLASALVPYAASAMAIDLRSRFELGAKHWNVTHVPISALGRFYLDAYLPDHIARILYLDGDTLAVGDLAELMHFSPPRGKLAAAEDISFFSRNDWSRFGRSTREYCSGLGIEPGRGYLNSGVLMAERGAWKDIMREALAYFEANSGRCRYHDQSALNAVVGERRLRISPKWNFQTPFRYWGVEARIKPRLYHFTEFPKPWMGDAEPWLEVRDEMREGAAAFAHLGLPDQRLPPEKIAEYNRLKIDRARRLKRMPIRLWRRRRDIERLAANAAI